MKNLDGFSLLELLITLAIASILFGVAIPSFSRIIEKNQISANMHDVQHQLIYARSLAVDRKKDISICGSNNTTTCSKFWTENILIFEDANDNKLAEPDEIIRLYALNLTKGKIKSRMSFGGIKTSFSSIGISSGGGSFVYCPNDKNAKKYRRVTWNRIGRSYQGQDNNGDGIVEDTTGKNITCY